MPGKAIIYDLDGCFLEEEYPGLIGTLRKSLEETPNNHSHNTNLNERFMDEMKELESYYNPEKAYVLTSRPFHLLSHTTKSDIKSINEYRENDITAEETILFPGYNLDGKKTFMDDDKGLIIKGLGLVASNLERLVSERSFYDEFYKKNICPKYKEKIIEGVSNKNGFDELLFLDDTKDIVDVANKSENVEAFHVEDGKIQGNYEEVLS